MQPSSPQPPGRLRTVPRRVRRAVLVRRRPLAVLAVAIAVLSGLRAVEPPSPATGRVLVARHDLPGGAPLRPADLGTVAYLADHVPSGALTDAKAAVGRTLASPVRAGEAVTDVRLVAPSLLDGYPGSVAAPVRVADAGAVALLRVGDRVDLVAASPDGGGASVVAARAPVVAVPRVHEQHADLMTGALVVVAVDPEVALALAAASVTAVLSVTMNR